LRLRRSVIGLREKVIYVQIIGTDRVQRWLVFIFVGGFKAQAKLNRRVHKSAQRIKRDA